MKLIFLCRRRSDLTHDRYTELLLRGHVPIALRHHPTLRKRPRNNNYRLIVALLSALP